MKLKTLLLTIVLSSVYVGLQSQNLTVTNSSSCPLLIEANCGTTCSAYCASTITYVAGGGTTVIIPSGCTWTEAHKWIYVKYWKPQPFPYGSGGIHSRLSNCAQAIKPITVDLDRI